MTLTAHTHHTCLNWPPGLQPPSQLQLSIHGEDQTVRQALISALAASYNPKDKSRASRLNECGRTARIYIDPTTNRVSPWIQRCGSRLCPTCGRRRTAKLQDQVAAIVRPMQAPKHLVLTRQADDASLDACLRTMKAGFHWLRRQPEWKASVTGGLYTLECKHNATTARWHVHIHAIIDGHFLPRAKLLQAWQRRFPGSWSQHISAITDTPAAIQEICKYVTKPPGLTTWQPRTIREYACNITHHRLIQTFGDTHGNTVTQKRDIPEPSPQAYTVQIEHLLIEAERLNPIALDILALIHLRWTPFRRLIATCCPNATGRPHLRTIQAVGLPAQPLHPHRGPPTPPEQDLYNYVDCLLLRLFKAWHDAAQLMDPDT